MKYAPSGLFLAVAACLLAATGARADIAIFGPGGPAAPMREAAKAFEDETGIGVTVTTGPTSQWMDEAKMDADAIFSGSQNMMDDFIGDHGSILPDSVVPLYLRPSAILVRKGNPQDVTGIADLVERDLSVMVVDGAGQVGLWEDIVGRMRDIDAIAAFRANIDVIAPNSGAALKIWTEDETVDAFLIWNHWQIENPDVADMVPTEPELTIYRDTSIAPTEKGASNVEVAQFFDFLSGSDAAAIFESHGWKKNID